MPARALQRAFLGVKGQEKTGKLATKAGGSERPRLPLLTIPLWPQRRRIHRLTQHQASRGLVRPIWASRASSPECETEAALGSEGSAGSPGVDLGLRQLCLRARSVEQHPVKRRNRAGDTMLTLHLTLHAFSSLARFQTEKSYRPEAA